MEQSIELLKSRQSQVVREMQSLPDDKLMISSNGDYHSCFIVKKNNGKRSLKSINSDQELVYKLAHRVYLEELLRRLNHNIVSTELYNSDILPLDYKSVLSKLPKNYKILKPERIINPDIESDDNFYPNLSVSGEIQPADAILKLFNISPLKWAVTPYRANTINLDRKIHLTSKGVYVRSKGEMAALEKYDSLGIKYHYDEVININGKLVSPDIIGCRESDNTIIYHEHAGIFSPEYYNHFCKKIMIYASAGIVLGQNLIITYDDPSGATDMRLMEASIRNIYHL